MKNYELLEREIEEISQINNVISILSWDVVVKMPIGSAESKAKENASLKICDKVE